MNKRVMDRQNTAVPYMDLQGRRLSLRKDMRKAVSFFLCAVILLAANFRPVESDRQELTDEMLSSGEIAEPNDDVVVPGFGGVDTDFPVAEWEQEPTIQGEMIFFDPNFLYNNGFSGEAPVTEPVVQGQIKVACVGDSLTYGYGVMDWENNNYPAVLQNMLAEGYHVQNFGASNYCVKDESDHPYTSHDNYAESLAYDADILVLMMGSNDAKTKNWTNAEDYKAALCALLDSYGDVQVVLCTPPTFYPDGVSEEGVSVYGHQLEVIAQVADVIREVAQERGYALVDFYELSLSNPQWFTIDGVHLNVEGAVAIAEAVYGAVSEIVVNK